MSDKLTNARRIIADHLAEIETLFTGKVYLTIVARNPHLDREPHSASLVVTNDNIDTVVEALAYLKNQETI